MASRKLSDTDKESILGLYRLPGETTTTLAERYGVSSSTISRVLKQHLPEVEYRQLIRQKRSTARTDAAPEPGTDAIAVPAIAPKTQLDSPKTDSHGTEEELDSPGEGIEIGSEPELELDQTAPRRVPAPVRRHTASTDAEVTTGQLELAPVVLESEEPDDNGEDEDEALGRTPWENGDDDNDDPEAHLHQEDYDDDDLDDDLDDEDLDDDLEDDWETGEAVEQRIPRSRQEQVEILPFGEVSLGRAYYLVVDRLSELITCPLKDFSELGQIPEEEEQALTLPVFDNHRVARRFSRRNQRVVKVPDGSVLQKTQPYLQAKGITRLLIDGQVYALL